MGFRAPPPPGRAIFLPPFIIGGHHRIHSSRSAKSIHRIRDWKEAASHLVCAWVESLWRRWKGPVLCARRTPPVQRLPHT